MPVDIVQTPMSVTALLSGEIDHHNASAMRQTIDDCIQSKPPSVLRLDFTEVSFMDSSGIGLVMGRYRLMQLLGGRVQVVGLTRRQHQLMQLSGLEKLASLSLREEEVGQAAMSQG